MSNSIPDVVQTSRYRDEDEKTLSNDVEKDEFFLTKQSKLFSQVSNNTLKTTNDNENSDDRDDHCKVVEVKAGEIVKAMAASTNADRFVLSRANFGVQQVPQVKNDETSVCE